MHCAHVCSMSEIRLVEMLGVYLAVIINGWTVATSSTKISGTCLCFCNGFPRLRYDRGTSAYREKESYQRAGFVD